MDHLEINAFTNCRLVFVVGCFRSGTSLLHRLLSAHPEMALMYECDALKFLPGRVQVGWQPRLDLWNGCLSRHRLEGASLPRCGTREEIALALYRSYAASLGGRSVIGEKSPYYADILPRLARAFPLAHFIVLARHPEEIVRSVKTAGKTNRFFAKSWMPARVRNDAICLRRDSQNLLNAGYSVTTINYDELVADPTSMAR